MRRSSSTRGRTRAATVTPARRAEGADDDAVAVAVRAEHAMRVASVGRGGGAASSAPRSVTARLGPRQSRRMPATGIRTQSGRWAQLVAAARTRPSRARRARAAVPALASRPSGAGRSLPASQVAGEERVARAASSNAAASRSCPRPSSVAHEVRERAQHAGDVASGESSAAARRCCAPARLRSRVMYQSSSVAQHLAEVEVAVRADQVAASAVGASLRGDLTQLLRPSDDARRESSSGSAA